MTGSASTAAGPGQAVARGRYDKLKICNEALINMANRPSATSDDGTDEWTIASSAFDQWLDIRMTERTWGWAQQVSQPLARIGDSPYAGYADAFQKPPACLFIANVWRSDLA